MRPARLLTALTLGLALGATAATARADVIPYPPASCPAPGAPASCHGGPYCKVTECDAATPCAAGQRCQAIEGCFRDLQCAGDVNPEDLPKYIRASYDGPCAGACCATRSVCMDADAPTPSPTPAKRTGCAGGGDAGGLLALAALVARRARRGVCARNPVMPRG